jgi:hypothetical protein
VVLGEEMERARQGRLLAEAGSLILAEAGGHADTLDGRPAALDLVPRSALCAADCGLFEQWRAYLRAN